MARSLAFLSMLVFLSAYGCASSGHGSSEEWRLRNLEENFLEFKETQLEQNERISAMEETVADMLAEMRRQRVDAGVVLDAPRPSEVSEETRQAMAMYESMFQAAEEDTDLPAEQDLNPTETEVSAEAEESKEAQEERQTPAVAGTEKAPAKKPEPEPVPQKTGQSSDPLAAYRTGLGLVRGEAPAKGREILESFTKTWPEHELVPNAMYWIGESYYNEKRYDRAILAFKDVYRLYPEHPKAAASLLKSAYSYQKLGDLNNARFHLSVLLEDFPDSEPAVLARKKLDEIAG